MLGYNVVDVACGSGDAQTLAITDDDSVWSWGDGDYGKLGRGGSDGCKVGLWSPLQSHTNWDRTRFRFTVNGQISIPKAYLAPVSLFFTIHRFFVIIFT